MRERLPEWLRRPSGVASATADVKRLLRRSQLNTVCEEARCPNIAECFSRGTATFMILGDICTRGCRFCAVTTGKPQMAASSFEAEGARVAQAAAELGLSHVVVTSVARDDLPDGGAQGFVHTIKALQELSPPVTIEVLVPDFRGKRESIQTVAEAGPDVFNHNLETVPRLYRKVRPGSGYQRSLDVLTIAREVLGDVGGVKTGVMLGLGEEEAEVRQVMHDAHSAGANIFTAGQYMQPSRTHLGVERYLAPEEFDGYRTMAEGVGFRGVFVGPLVRSSYHAEETFVQQGGGEQAGFTIG